MGGDVPHLVGRKPAGCRPGGRSLRPGRGAKPAPAPRPGSPTTTCTTGTLPPARGPQHGWPNQLWTADRVAALIRDASDLTTTPNTSARSSSSAWAGPARSPRRRAREQNDKEVERWRGDEFPRIVRDAWRRQATLVFLDEAGFMLTPTVRRTLAPRGQTPMLPAWQRHDRISAISCVTLGRVQSSRGCTSS